MSCTEAFKEFRRKLGKIIPRISLIGQCYVESVFQPFLIKRSDCDIAWVRYTRDTKGVPLMFGEEELKGLKILLKNSEVSEEFYRYWNDAVNTIGYSPKLLVMFSALEALFKKERGESKRAYYAKIETVLGPELKTELYGTEGNSTIGLRQRLVHGEYLTTEDTTQNYVELIHKRLIGYFNDSIFMEKLIGEHVVHPHRHLFGNKEECRFFLKAKEGKKLSLKEVLSDLDKNGTEDPKDYERVCDEQLVSTY